MWNAVSYFESLKTKLKATKDTHVFCRVSGLDNLEELLTKGMASKAFFAVDDSDDGATVRRGGGYFNRRSVVVYILKKYRITDMTAREAALEECRGIYKSLLSKILLDSNELAALFFLNKERIPYHEMPGMFAVETTGLYFILTFEESINLEYNAAEWTA